MDSVIDIVRILLPVILVGGIAVFVVMRMKYKYKRGTLGKKQSKRAQVVLDSLIPLGMISGSAVAILFSTVFSISLIAATSLGAAVGLLLGYFAYEIYSRMEEK